jgi:DnaJ-class molecular chaperone
MDTRLKSVCLLSVLLSVLASAAPAVAEEGRTESLVVAGLPDKVIMVSLLPKETCPTCGKALFEVLYQEPARGDQKGTRFFTKKLCTHCGREICPGCGGHDLTKETCRACGGRDLAKETCPTCGGKDLSERCPWCEGSGHSGGKQCIVCNGTGRVGACIACHGTGKRHACSVCNGTGKQPACVLCGGKGIIQQNFSLQLGSSAGKSSDSPETVDTSKNVQATAAGAEGGGGR